MRFVSEPWVQSEHSAPEHVTVEAPTANQPMALRHVSFPTPPQPTDS
jgi:hypothetical protein